MDTVTDADASAANAAGHGEPGWLTIVDFNGSEFPLEVGPSATAEEIYQFMAKKVGIKPGSVPVLLCGGSVLDEARSVLQQVDGEAIKEITYVVKQVGAGPAAVSLMRVLVPGVQNCQLSPAEARALNAVRSLTLCDEFNQSLEGVTLPSSLQTLTFGAHFNQSLDGVTLPSSLQTLTFGDDFNQILEGATLPRSLQTLTFGAHFNQSLEGVSLLSSLQTLTFGDDFNQSLEDVTLPSSLQTLTFGDEFNQSLEFFTRPSNLQTLRLNLRRNVCRLLVKIFDVSVRSSR